MKLQVQYREADFREANAQAVKAQKVKPRPVEAVIAVAVGLICGLALAMTNVIGVALRQKTNAARDMVMILGPGIVSNLLFLVLTIAALLSQLKRARLRALFAGPQPSGSVRWARFLGMLTVPVVMAIFFTVDLVPTVEWNTSRRVALLVGLLPFATMFVALIIFLSWYQRKMLGATWQGHANLHRPRELEFTDEAVKSVDPTTSVDWKWSAFVRFRETPNLFILVLEDSRFIMVPKRDLSAAEKMVEFRAMLQTHIAEGYFLTVPMAAFPVVNAVTLPPVIEALPPRTGM